MTSFGAQISASRVASGELSVRQRNSIISKHEAGVASRDLAAEFRCSKRTINRTIQRFQSTYSNQSRPRSGQLPKLSRRERRYLFRLARQQPKIEYRQMQRELEYWLTDEDYPRVSATTLRAALKEWNFQKFRARRRPKII